MLQILLLLLVFSSCARSNREREPLPPRYSITKQSAKTRLPIVVLDPGHGGESLGTQTVTLPHIPEKTLCLQCSMKVAKFLEDWGYSVRLTRSRDETVTLQKRVQIAHGGSFFVSIHFNHAPNAEANGVEIFYYKDGKRDARSKLLAKECLRYIVRETDCFSRGIHAGNFHVIRENSIPAILIEGGFCSNVHESRKLSDPKYITKLAFAIARGIDSFVERVKDGQG